MNLSADKIPPEQIELLVLRAMCQGTPQGSLRAEGARLLARYAWREPVHQAIFNCLSIIPSVEPEDLCRGLIACLTRRGFPDVELGIFFEPHGLPHQDAMKLMGGLRQSGSE